jgi:cytoskeletal protein CcmA (bactofilin family)
MAWKKSGTPPRPPAMPAAPAAPAENPPAGEVRRLGPTRLPSPIAPPEPIAPIAPIAPIVPAASPSPAGALVLPESLSFHGELSGAADLVIEGRFEGNISLPGNEIRVNPGSRVKADVLGRVIVVEGEVEGDLTAGDKILVMASGAVRGNAKAPRVTLEDGARFRGKIEMEGEA